MQACRSSRGSRHTRSNVATASRARVRPASSTASATMSSCPTTAAPTRRTARRPRVRGVHPATSRRGAALRERSGQDIRRQLLVLMFCFPAPLLLLFFIPVIPSASVIVLFAARRAVWAVRTPTSRVRPKSLRCNSGADRCNDGANHERRLLPRPVPVLGFSLGVLEGLPVHHSPCERFHLLIVQRDELGVALGDLRDITGGFGGVATGLNGAALAEHESFSSVGPQAGGPSDPLIHSHSIHPRTLPERCLEGKAHDDARGDGHRPGARRRATVPHRVDSPVRDPEARFEHPRNSRRGRLPSHALHAFGNLARVPKGSKQERLGNSSLSRDRQAHPPG